MIDVVHQISSIDRQVGRRTLEAGEARTITVSRVYDAPPDDLWDACTNPERVSRWFLPISGDLRPGGRYDSRATRPAQSSAASRPTACPRPGSTAARPRGSNCASRASPMAVRGSRSSTSPTSTTSSGPSSARAPWASAGTRPSSA